MPKILLVKLEVPSHSRPAAMLGWLNKLLEPHRMKVLSVTDDLVEMEKSPQDFDSAKRSDSGWDGGA